MVEIELEPSFVGILRGKPLSILFVFGGPKKKHRELCELSKFVCRFVGSTTGRFHMGSKVPSFTHISKQYTHVA